MPVAAVTPTTLAFPTELVGTASLVESAVLTNLGGAPFSVSTVTSSLADFGVTDNCPTSWVGGQNCSASITFRPVVGGQRKGTVTFDLSGVKSKSVSVSGRGASVTVSLSVLIMYDGAPGTVTVTNPLSTSETLKSIRVYGPTQTKQQLRHTRSGSELPHYGDLALFRAPDARHTGGNGQVSRSTSRWRASDGWTASKNPSPKLKDLAVRRFFIIFRGPQALNVRVGDRRSA